MHKTTIHIIILLFSTFLFTISGRGPDSAAMNKLAASLRHRPWGWSTKPSSNYCTWTHVFCDGYLHVTAIDLNSLSLSGVLPKELSDLSYLETLILSNNTISGPLPSLANLNFLTQVHLENDEFTNISLEHFPYSLKYLYFGNNSSLEPWSLTSGLNKLKNLVVLAASNTNLQGPLPNDFGSSSNLSYVDLSYNKLSGSLPHSLRGSSVLYSLQLNNQQPGLTGTLDVLSGMVSLFQVWLNNNQFTGPLPSFQQCINLYDVKLGNNLLTGPVPESLILLPQLLSISLTDNELQGRFPRFPETVFEVDVGGSNSFCTDTGHDCDPQVTTLIQISGDLGYPMILAKSWKGNDACNDWPFVMCNSEGVVTSMNLSYQSLTGKISEAFVNLTGLEKLHLKNNNLEGVIPDGLTKLTSLQMLDASNNNLSGTVPAFSSLVRLFLDGNPALKKGKNDISTKVIEKSTVVIFVGIVATVVVCMFCLGKRIIKRRGSRSAIKEKVTSQLFGQNLFGTEINLIKLHELLILDFQTILTATNRFHLDNKLGQGGYGPVFWGKLQNGHEIAVKRLSITSTQGSEQFMNEVLVISKLQHRNLVRLLGCCFEKNDKMLVYEYMPNKSLDMFIFDPLKQQILDLSIRWNIIEGIARGLLYLHRDSILKIIHRDLKASNILLDERFSPKISDFGLARIFYGSQDQADTGTVVGTRGYMAPEYLSKGKFSEKSDVFSFGVLILEIISGRRNTSFYNNEIALSVVGYAWRLWEEGNIEALIDPSVSGPHSHVEISRCIQVGLLCVQQSPEDRPTVFEILCMLHSKIRDLPLPKQPEPFFQKQFGSVGESSRYRQQQQIYSINDVTLTPLQGR